MHVKFLTQGLVHASTQHVLHPKFSGLEQLLI